MWTRIRVVGLRSRVTSYIFAGDSRPEQPPKPWPNRPFHDLISLCAVALLAIAVATEGCHCADPRECKPLLSPFPEQELFMFYVNTDKDPAWRHMAWDSVTTIAAIHPPSPEMVCMAHSHGVRVVFSVAPDKVRGRGLHDQINPQ